jgi:hypothetical protein
VFTKTCHWSAYWSCLVRPLTQPIIVRFILYYPPYARRSPKCSICFRSLDQKSNFPPACYMTFPVQIIQTAHILKKYVNNHTTITSLSLLHNLTTCFQVAARSLRKIFVQVSTVLQCSLACYCSQSVNFRVSTFGLLSSHNGYCFPACHFYSSLKILRPDVEG